jgi:hypothetical protein
MIAGRKPDGMTPTIWWGSPPSTNCRLSTSSAPPNRRCQKSWLTMTTRGAFGTHSSGRNVRPFSGGTPSTSKYSCVTCSPFSISASPSPVSAGPKKRIDAIDANVPVSACQSTRLPGVAHSLGGPPRLRMSCHTMTSSFAAGYGSGLSSTACTTVKIDVFAPMPSAMVRTAAAVKAGDLRSSRRAKRR